MDLKEDCSQMTTRRKVTFNEILKTLSEKVNKIILTGVVWSMARWRFVTFLVTSLFYSEQTGF